MANKTAKNEKNVAGKYYVDNTCISCGQCCDIASDYFVEDTMGGMYVQKQPSTQDEINLCEQALSSCPVDSIGNDGE